MIIPPTGRWWRAQPARAASRARSKTSENWNNSMQNNHRIAASSTVHTLSSILTVDKFLSWSSAVAEDLEVTFSSLYSFCLFYCMNYRMNILLLSLSLLSIIVVYNDSMIRGEGLFEGSKYVTFNPLPRNQVRSTQLEPAKLKNQIFQKIKEEEHLMSCNRKKRRNVANVQRHSTSLTLLFPFDRRTKTFSSAPIISCYALMIHRLSE